MRLIYYTFFMVLIVNSSLAQWIDLSTPQSGLIGSRVLDQNIITTSTTDKMKFSTYNGSDEDEKNIEKYFQANIGIADIQKIRNVSVTVKNTLIDYIDLSLVEDNSNFIDNYFIEKAIRAGEVEIKLTTLKKGNLKPKIDLFTNNEFIRKLIKNLSKIDTLSLNYTDSLVQKLVIKNSNVYFKVFVSKYSIFGKQITIVPEMRGGEVAIYTAPINRKVYFNLGKGLPNFILEVGDVDTLDNFSDIIFKTTETSFVRGNVNIWSQTENSIKIKPKITSQGHHLYDLPCKNIGKIIQAEKLIIFHLCLSGEAFAGGHVNFERAKNKNLTKGVRFFDLGRETCIKYSTYKYSRLNAKRLY